LSSKILQLKLKFAQQLVRFDDITLAALWASTIHPKRVTALQIAPRPDGSGQFVGHDLPIFHRHHSCQITAAAVQLPGELHAGNLGGL
jgi:hypothetical protein